MKLARTFILVRLVLILCNNNSFVIFVKPCVLKGLSGSAYIFLILLVLGFLDFLSCIGAFLSLTRASEAIC